VDAGLRRHDDARSEGHWLCLFVLQLSIYARASGHFFKHRKILEMSIIGWLVLGLLAGFIASKIVNNQGEGLIVDMALGIAGAFIGGFMFTSFGVAGVTGFNVYSMVVATIGAIVVLLIYHALFNRRAL
jgi:uncharacterized membrane protein YeaQ/YmgE (transglycosylase-associated protein family)